MNNYSFCYYFSYSQKNDLHRNYFICDYSWDYLIPGKREKKYVGKYIQIKLITSQPETLPWYTVVFLLNHNPFLFFSPQMYIDTQGITNFKHLPATYGPICFSHGDSVNRLIYIIIQSGFSVVLPHCGHLSHNFHPM